MSSPPPLQNHRCLIVGASSGIGRASAERMLRDGARVLIASRTEAALEKVAAELAPVADASGGTIRLRVCDGSDREQVRAAVEDAAEGERLDSAVTVPGGGNYAPVLGYDDEDFMAQVDVNLRPTYLMIKYAGLAMVKGGGGSIVAVSSTASILSSPFLAAYCAAKAAVDQLVRVAADEVGRHGIRVNAIRPGLTATGSTEGMMGQSAIVDRFLAEQPLPRPGQPQDQAGLVRFLAGPESSWVTGQSITVDGGHTLRRFPDMEDLARQVVGEETFAKIERGEDPIS